MSNSSGSDTKPDDVKMTARSVSKARLSTRKKFLFAVVFCSGILLALEFSLYLLGFRTLADSDDPSNGFSDRFSLFVPSKSENGEDIYETASNRLNLFNQQHFLARKPKNGFRIFCLGGSTTYGRPYDDETSFCGLLRIVLPELDPSHHWEVINAGGISYASPRIAILMQELIRYEPDLFIFYTGHNEFLEQRTYESLLKTPESVRTLRGVASYSRIYTAMHHATHPEEVSFSNKSTANIDEVNTLLDRSIGPTAYHRDEEWREDVIAEFRENLTRVIALAKSAKSRVIFVSPAAKLRDCKPFKSEHRSDLSGDQLANFQQHQHSAKQHLAKVEFKQALACIESALEIDDQYANAHFLRGRILFEMGEFKRAKMSLQRALEEDVCPLRANLEIVGIVRDVAQDHKLPLVDFADMIDQVSENGIPGEDWFLDHVHPTLIGHQLLANALGEQLAQLNVTKDALDWDEKSFYRISDRHLEEIDRSKHAMALRNLAKVLSWAGKDEEADALIVKAVNMLPDDAEAHTMAGTAALRQSEFDVAKSHYKAALKIDPLSVRSIVGLGNILSQQGNHQAALEEFAKALKVDASHSPAWFNLGNAYRELGNYESASNAYHKALSIEKNQPDVHKNLGLVYLSKSDIDNGVKHFEIAVKLDPNNSLRHAELGFALIDAAEIERAAMEFQKALEIDPNEISGMIGTALLYARQGRRSDAIRILTRAQSLEPENNSVRNLLLQIKSQ